MNAHSAPPKSTWNKLADAEHLASHLLDLHGPLDPRSGAAIAHAISLQEEVDRELDQAIRKAR